MPNSTSGMDNDLKDRSLLLITFVIVVLHAAFLGWAALDHSSMAPRQPSVKRLVVQTVTLKPQTVVEIKEEIAVQEIAPPTQPPLPIPEEVIAEVIPEPIMEVQEPQEAPKVIEEAPACPEVKPEEPKPEATPPPPSKPTPAPPNEKKQAPKKSEKKPEKKPEKKKETPKKAPPKKDVEPVKKDPPKNKAEKPPVKKVEKPKEKKPVPEKKGPTKEELAAAENKRKLEQAAADKKRQLEAEQQAQKVRQQQLLAQAQERIAKIAPSKDKSSPGRVGDVSLAAVPTAITSLQIDALPGVDAPVLSDREISYRDELASRLKLLLRLPEYGDVKVKLTLSRSGKVSKVVILSAENGANRKYIEKTLPTLNFPSFGVNFSDAEEYTFAITLSNE